MELYKETSPTGSLNGGHTSVGLTAVPVCGSFPLKRGIVLRCPGPSEVNGNTDIVWVGRQNMTADSGPAGGMPILPGTGIFLPIDDPSQLYVVSTTAGQDIAWMCV